ncbi:MAG: substrate-binding domain-containing protein, partial [Propionibacteriaceae bacterium]|nr:substrate-binding domain-containing protein [Propionibacteriaceae bacterium]
MKNQIKYFALTVLAVGVLIPIPASLAGLACNIFLDGPGVALLTAVPTVVAGFLAYLALRLLKRFIPDTLGRGLAPVLAVFAYYELAYAVPLVISDFDASAFEMTSSLALPWLPLNFILYFMGDQIAYVFVQLGCFVAQSLVVAAVIAKNNPNTPWKKGIVWVLAGALVVGAGVAGEEYFHWQAVLRPDNEVVRIADEVDTYDYLPQNADNKLQVLDDEPTTTIDSDYPKIDGATAGVPVYGAVAQALYRNISWDGDETTVTCSKTAQAYERLLIGDTDVVFAAQPSKRQLEAAAAAGVSLSQTPIAREAFVFVVNADNPVESLTTGQIRQIYQKQITNWKDVGGGDQQIMPFQRPEDSGSQTIMEAKVMDGGELPEPLKEEVASGMGGLVKQVAEYRNYSQAIGYSFRWYATVMTADPNIKLLSVDGVAPTVENIRNGSYPLTVDVFAVTAGTKNPNVPKLIDWTLSPQGQAFVEK